jgi:ferric-dicitrate binding protein FerR (iron transport regulator)
MISRTELTELCGAVRDGNASPEQVVRLEACLSESEEARRYYLRFAQISALLERYEQVPSVVTPSNVVKPGRFAPRRAVLLVLALAAGLAVALLLPSVRKSAQPAGAASSTTTIATIQDVQDASLVVAGDAVALRGGHRLAAGEVIATDHEGAAVLRVHGEETVFILGADTRAWLGLEGATKLIHLAYGQVSGDVAKQPPGSQWRVVTTDGEATVLGTQLTVTAGGSGTRVAVTSGLVRATSRDRRESIETPAGYATRLTPTTAVRTKLASTTQTRLTSFTLVHADTNAPIAGYEQIADGSRIDLATLPTRRLNIRANCEPLLVGAVRFQLSGTSPDGEPLSLQLPATNGFPNSIEIFYPHLLAGDPSIEDLPLPSHSNPWTPDPGRYRLAGTPYADRKSSGMRGVSLSIEFEIVDSEAK